MKKYNAGKENVNEGRVGTKVERAEKFKLVLKSLKPVWLLDAWRLAIQKYYLYVT